MSRIAIIGWGSLIWDLEILTPHTTGDWLMEHGPRLPMEFSRVSHKRKMGLVVCLDPFHGTECMTHVVRSTKNDISQTIDDLAARERAPLGLIGAVHVGGFQKGRMQHKRLGRGSLDRLGAEFRRPHGAGVFLTGGAYIFANPAIRKPSRGLSLHPIRPRPNAHPLADRA